jgi:transcriptional regulator with XRE-family HTH domain
MKKLGERIRAARIAAGLTQREVGDRFGIDRVNVTQWEAETTKPDADKLPALADVLKVSLDWLMTGVGPSPPVPAPKRNVKSIDDDPPANYRPPPDILGARDLPIFAAAEGGDGELVITTDPIEMVPRPWYLGEVRNGFGVIISGESMIEAYRPGDIAIVNPRLPFLRDEPHIFTNGEHASAHEYRATIKHLVGATAKEWQVKQFNPPKALTLAKAEWPVALRVVGKFNRR